MANPVGSIATVQHVNPTTQPAAAKPAANVQKLLRKTASTSAPQAEPPARRANQQSPATWITTATASKL